MSKVWFLLPIILAFTQAKVWMEHETSQLRGLDSVEVIVDLNENGDATGLLPEGELKKQVEGKLRQAGLHIGASRSLVPVLYLGVVTLSTDAGVVFYAELGLTQMATIARNSEIGFADIKADYTMGITRPDELRSVLRDKVYGFVDSFLIGWLMGNK